MSKASVELATQAFKANNITNTRIARLSSEEFTEAYEGRWPPLVLLLYINPLGLMLYINTRIARLSPGPSPIY